MPDVVDSHTADSRSTIAGKLCSLIQATPGRDDLSNIDENTLIADLCLDSLRLVEVIFEMESYFNSSVDEGLMTEANTLGDVVSLFSAQIRKGAD